MDQSLYDGGKDEARRPLDGTDKDMTSEDGRRVRMEVIADALTATLC